MSPAASRILPRVLVALAVCGVAGVLLVSPVDAGSKKAYPLPTGSRIAGVDVGGLPPQEAVKHIDTLWATFKKTSWRVTVGDVVLKPTAAELGLAPDIPAVLAKLETTQTPPRTGYDHIQRLVFSPAAVSVALPLTLDQDAFDAWVQSVRKQVDRAPGNAIIDWKTGAITPETKGQTFDKGNLQQQMAEPLSELEARSLEAAIKALEPPVTSLMLGRLNLTSPFATYTTDFDVKKASRSHNIAVAVAKWDGQSIGPGETISFNTTVGKRSAANGFKKAPVYENRRVSEGLGGGICQVSTTLYNAALLGGLEVIERGGHSRPCTYAPPGRDATVDWPNRDLKLRNPYDFPLFIHAHVEGGSVTFTLFGDLSQKPSITLDEAVTGLGGPGAAQVIIDPSLKPGTTIIVDKGFSGRKVIVTRIWNAGTDQERKEVVSTDRTSALSGIIRKNPLPGGDVAPEEAPAEEVIEPEPTGDQDKPDIHF